jgi:hypothetical protein
MDPRHYVYLIPLHEKPCVSVCCQLLDQQSGIGIVFTDADMRAEKYRDACHKGLPMLTRRKQELGVVALDRMVLGRQEIKRRKTDDYLNEMSYHGTSNER